MGQAFMTDLRCNLLRNRFICSFVSHFLFVISVVRMGIFASVGKWFTFAFIVPFNFQDFESTCFVEHFSLLLSLHVSFSLTHAGKRKY